MSILKVLGNAAPTKMLQAVNALSPTKRASIVDAAIAGPTGTSDDGKVAVGSKGIGSTLIKGLGTAAQIAGDVLPGPIGAIAKFVGRAFNNKEWWESVKGDAITCNDPLRTIDAEVTGDSRVYACRALHTRFALVEFRSWNSSNASGGVAYGYIKPHVITPNENMITQYLMPEIRSVVNAVPLQTAQAYEEVLSANAAIYAIYQQLKKFDYMLKHGSTYLQSMNDVAFPLFQTVNASYLQATIKRLEEYLRSSVRMPHTLCEYLAWRFGRVYRSNDSSKAGLVLYNALPIAGNTILYDRAIKLLMDQVAASGATQQANADMYNAYKNHDCFVDVKDETQFKYDRKEFAARCNMSGFVVCDNNGGYYSNINPTIKAKVEAGEKICELPARPVMMDSEVDNPTVFMSSTVSALGKERASTKADVLFPVAYEVRAYIPGPWFDGTADQTSGEGPRVAFLGTYGDGNYRSGAYKAYTKCTYVEGVQANDMYHRDGVSGSSWSFQRILMDHIYNPCGDADHFGEVLMLVPMLKSLDLYNMGIFIPVCPNTGANEGVAFGDNQALDITTLSIDEGQPTVETIETEHVYAFANLVNVKRNRSESLKEVEKELATETANMIEKLDVAAVADAK